MDRLRVLVGDARALAGGIENVQTVVTSPPYWHLRDYGVAGQIGMEPTIEAFVEAMVVTFREVRRALRKDGVCWVNLGDSYSGSRKGSTGKSSTLTNLNRYELARVPNVESKSTMCGLPRKNLLGIPWRVALALQADGWMLRSTVVWSKPCPVPGSMLDRPTSAHEYVFMLTRSGRYYYDADAVRTPLRPNTLRLQKYGGKRTARTKDPRAASFGMAERMPSRRPRLDVDGNALGANLRDVWTFGGGRYRGDHFATFPIELPRRCILASSRPGDLVLDPFVGSGTVLEAAIGLGRRGVGIDLDPEAPRRIENRIAGMQLESPGAARPTSDYEVEPGAGEDEE
jgi:DNA modification methylase